MEIYRVVNLNIVRGRHCLWMQRDLSVYIWFIKFLPLFDSNLCLIILSFFWHLLLGTLAYSYIDIKFSVYESQTFLRIDV